MIGQSAALRSSLGRHMLALIAQAKQAAACNASHSVEARMARLLLRARDFWDARPGNLFSLPTGYSKLILYAR